VSHDPRWGGIRRLAAAAALVAGAALAGCGGGGGGDATEEDSLRLKMEQGFDKVADARSVDVSLDFQVGEEGSSSNLIGGCLELSVDQQSESETDDMVDMKAIEGGCDGAAVQARIIAIGRDVYVSQSGSINEYAPGRIDPQVIPELTSDTADFDELPEAAEDIKEAATPGKFTEPDGSAGEGPTIEFKAPSSAFGDATELDDADVDVDFEATFDKQGYLRLLIGTVEAEGAKAVITVTYENINAIEPIKAPGKAEVKGKVRQIHSEDELEALLEGPLGGAF
jgi:hypothetical protein